MQWQHKRRTTHTRHNTFAHYAGPQLAACREGEKSEPSRKMNTGNRGEKRPIEQIDREDAKGDIATPEAVVVRKHRFSADILPSAQCLASDLCNSSGVAESEVQPLRADGRNNVRSFSDERDA
jgi:hypothetical protein